MKTVYHFVKQWPCSYTREISRKIKDVMFVRINQDGIVISKYKAGEKV